MTRSARIPGLPIAALAFAGVLFAATSAHAQRWERGHDYDGGEHVGLYFAAGLGGGLQLIDLDDGQLGGQAEVRIGYSFNRIFQIYLDADLSGSSHDFGTITANDVMVGLRYFLYANRFVGVYARGGIGLGIVSGVGSITFDGNDTEYGIAESYALGMEFRMGDSANKWAISPELFYRRTNETQDSRVDTMGLGILINFN